MKATPIDSLTASHITFFEGEPDTYCALAFDIEGAVTMGSKSKTDVEAMFGEEDCKILFDNKEIVICFDADEAGKVGAIKLANSLYNYAKQIKIIDLDKSDINPCGLDPKIFKDVGGKQKRVETDFTDFMIKNGFDENALKEYNELVKNTPVYTKNPSRGRHERMKVTLQESRTAKYYSPEGDVELELVATVSNSDKNSYYFWSKCKAECDLFQFEPKRRKLCSNCRLSYMPELDDGAPIVFTFVRKGMRAAATNDPHIIELSEHDILGMIEAPGKEMEAHQKKVLRIPGKCPFIKLTNFAPRKITHVELSKDVNEYEFKKKSTVGTDTNTSDITMHAYMIGERDLGLNKSYNFKGIQTTSWNGQYVVLFLDEAEAIMTSYESFKMDQKTHDLLQVFKPKDGESIKDHLKRRYDIFGNAIGLNGRRELIAMFDLAYFSPVEIRNKKLLPNVDRGWVEILIGGDSRCGKTIIATFFHNHYKVGEKIDCSTAVGRTGLLGGIVKFQNRSTIKWGKIVTNDSGIVTIDELACLNKSQLHDLTPMRSSGIAEITKIVEGRALARTRKIMLSNKRMEHDDSEERYSYGINMLKDICFKSEVLTRFDIGFVVKRDDVAIEDFSSTYIPISTEFTEFQCQRLIMWAYSRKPEELVFEDGIEECINNAQKEMLKKFHPSTDLVNQEMRAKLIRLATSLATLLYSHVPEDWDRILVTKEHVEYIKDFLTELYCHPNMKLDSYSEMKRRAEDLGDMRFMMNILKYINAEALLKNEILTDTSIKQTFIDYLGQVNERRMYMVDAYSDDIKKSGFYVNDANQKLIGTLIARNCIVRTKNNQYRKTKMFSDWLDKMNKDGANAEKSDILEFVKDEPHLKLLEGSKEFSRGGKKSSKQSAG